MTKSFGDRQILKGIDLEVREHEAIALIGASGSGKSTLLRCIDLLVEIDDGDIFLDGEVITDPSVDPVAVRRKLGYRLPAVQPLPPHDRAGERDARGGPGAPGPEEGGRGAGEGAARPVRPGRARGRPARPALRRPAAAGRA